LGQSGVGLGSVVGVGVVFGERVGRRNNGVGLASGMGGELQAESRLPVSPKRINNA
jgi:hypothetical protein